MTAQQILSKLVAFPVLGGQSNISIITWIQNYIEDQGIKTTLVPNIKETKASLHCRIGPAVDGGVVLSGHTDVVPVEGQNWTTNPFELTDKGDGKLYGRGSCDMKGFIACCLAALPKMISADLKTPIYFAFSYDEEIGCLAAPELIEHMKNHYTEKAKYAIIGEASMMQPIIGQKGIYILDVYVNGSQGHSSRVKQEVSAIHEAAKLILWLESKMDSLIERNTDQRFNPPHSSLHVGQIQGGIAPNVIADKAYFTVDIRTIPKDSAIEIREDFEAYCRSRENEMRAIFPDFKIEVKENHPDVPSLDTNENANIVDLIGELTGNYEWSTVAYAAEAGQFAEGGYESIICGPGSISMAHRADEYVEKSELDNCVTMIEKLATKLSSK